MRQTSNASLATPGLVPTRRVAPCARALPCCKGSRAAAIAAAACTPNIAGAMAHPGTVAPASFSSMAAARIASKSASRSTRLSPWPFSPPWNRPDLLGTVAAAERLESDSEAALKQWRLGVERASYKRIAPSTTFALNAALCCSVSASCPAPARSALSRGRAPSWPPVSFSRLSSDNMRHEPPKRSTP